MSFSVIIDNNVSFRSYASRNLTYNYRLSSKQKIQIVNNYSLLLEIRESIITYVPKRLYVKYLLQLDLIYIFIHKYTEMKKIWIIIKTNIL